jgi:hypothetical protein
MFMLFINFFQIFNPHHHCRQGEKKNDDIFYQVLQLLQLTHSMQQQIHKSRKVCVCMPDEIEKWKETEQLRRRKDKEVNKNII